MAEGGGLENRYTLFGYRGFESPSLRQISQNSDSQFHPITPMVPCQETEQTVPHKRLTKYVFLPRKPEIFEKKQIFNAITI